jgi:hypothetical protein
MDYHILNGMCLYEKFPAHIKGEKVVMNEALIDGPLGGNLSLEAFWQLRADFWKVSISDYKEKTVAPLQKLFHAKKEDSLIFWFGNDLFCQVNCWFLIYLIQEHKITSNIGMVYPPPAHDEETFGHYPPTFLKNSFFQPVFLNEEEKKMVLALWNLCKNADIEGLSNLILKDSPGFPSVAESIKTWIAIFPKEGKGLAQIKVEELVDQGINNFPELFRAFSDFFPHLGMGDRQVFAYYQSYMDKKNTKK